MIIFQKKFSYIIYICFLLSYFSVVYASAEVGSRIDLAVYSAIMRPNPIKGNDEQIEIMLSQDSAENFSQFTAKHTLSYISISVGSNEVWHGRLDTPIRGGKLIIPQVPSDKTLLERLNSGEAALTVETVPTRKR